MGKTALSVSVIARNVSLRIVLIRLVPHGVGAYKIQLSVIKPAREQPAVLSDGIPENGSGGIRNVVELSDRFFGLGGRSVLHAVFTDKIAAFILNEHQYVIADIHLAHPPVFSRGGDGADLPAVFAVGLIDDDIARAEGIDILAVGLDDVSLVNALDLDVGTGVFAALLLHRGIDCGLSVSGVKDSVVEQRGISIIILILYCGIHLRIALDVFRRLPVLTRRAGRKRAQQDYAQYKSNDFFHDRLL